MTTGAERTLVCLNVSDQLGGSEVVLLELLAEVRRRRPAWRTHVVMPGEGPLAARAASAGAAVHVLPMPAALMRLGEPRRKALGQIVRLASAAATLTPYQRRLERLLREVGAGILHSNGLKAHVVASRIRMNARRVWHLHDYIGPRAVTRRVLRRYAPSCDACVAVSYSVADDAARALGERLRAPVQVIGNGIDLQRFTPEGSRADLDALAGLPPAPPGTIRVGLVGTFARWKGHDVFLHALARLPPALPFRAYVVGGPIYDTTASQFTRDELAQLARACGCGDRLAFTGFVEDAPAVMRSLDIVVHASTRPEPFGLVLAEAMACGRAVTTSGLGGAAEVVGGPEPAAVMHAAGDAASLAAAIERLATDAAARVELAERAQRQAARHSNTVFGASFVRLYESLDTVTR